MEQTNPNLTMKIKRKSIENDDLIYINIKVFIPSRNQSTLASFNSTRNDAIIDKCSDYKLSILRWNLPSNFPLFLCPDQTELNRHYNVSLSFGTTTITKSLIYTDLNTGGFYPRSIYFVSQWVDMINIAYESAHTDLKIAEGGYTALIPPTINYDSNSSSRISLYAPIEFKEGNANNAFIKIQNSAFILGLQGIPSSKNFVNVGDGITDITFIVHQTLTNYYKTALPYPIQEFIVLHSEYDSSPAFNGLNSIIFETATIPVVSELVGSGGQIERRVLTDFFVGGSDSTTQGEVLSYYPDGPLRWYNLESDAELRTISVIPLIEFSDGQVYPIYVDSQQSWGVKILFQRRTSFEKLGYDLGKQMILNNQQEFDNEINDEID